MVVKNAKRFDALIRFHYFDNFDNSDNSDDSDDSDDFNDPDDYRHSVIPLL